MQDPYLRPALRRGTEDAVPWSRLDDGYPFHVKTIALSLEAVALDVMAICYASLHGTNGFVAHSAAQLLARGPRQDLFDELVHNRRWDMSTEGYQIHNFLVYNPSRAAISKRRKQWSNSKQKSRARQQGVHNDVHVDSTLTRKGRAGKGRDPSSPSSSEVLEGGLGGDLFASFWTVYPKKVGKQDARKAWDAIRPDAALATTITTSIAQQLTWPDFMREGGRYIPHPASWLNAKRWTDEPTKVAVPLLTPRGADAFAATEEWLRRTMPATKTPPPAPVRRLTDDRR